jgi:hypothetical protein
MKCVLHVNDHDYDHILQLNHNAVVWTMDDEVLLEHLVTVIGAAVVQKMRACDDCRMEKHFELVAPRVEIESEVAPAWLE